MEQPLEIVIARMRSLIPAVASDLDVQHVTRFTADVEANRDVYGYVCRTAGRDPASTMDDLRSVFSQVVSPVR